MKPYYIYEIAQNEYEVHENKPLGSIPKYQQVPTVIQATSKEEAWDKFVEWLDKMGELQNKIANGALISDLLNQ